MAPEEPPFAVPFAHLTHSREMDDDFDLEFLVSAVTTGTVEVASAAAKEVGRRLTPVESCVKHMPTVPQDDTASHHEADVLSRELEELKSRACRARTSCLTQVLDGLTDYFGSMEDPPAWSLKTQGATQEFGELVDAALGGALSSVGLPLSSSTIPVRDLKRVTAAVASSMSNVHKGAGSNYIRDAIRGKCVDQYPS